MGSAADEVKEIKTLGRSVRWTLAGTEHEVEEKHLAELRKKLAKAKEAPTQMRSVHALYVAEAETLEKKLK